MPYSPGQSYHTDQFISQGFGALASGLQEFAQQQRQAKQEADMQATENAKNDLIVQNLYKVGQVTPQQWAEYQSMAPTKRKGFAEGAAANAAFNIFQQKNAAAQAPLAVRPLPVPGGTPINVMTGQGMTPHILPPAPGPIASVPVPGLPGTTAITGGGLTQPHFVTDPSTGEKLTLSADELAAYKATGKVPLRISKGSFQAVNDPTLVKDSEPVKAFDEHVGKTYGIKSADIFNLNLAEPNAIQYQDKNGKPLSTEDAVKAGYSATAVVPVAGEFGTKTKRIPLPEWNNIVNQWQQLPRAGVPGAGGVSVQGGNPSATHMLGPQDQAALDWALANPKDPRASQIKQKLGIQ